MDLACSVVVLLMSCVFGSPVPSLDVNREGVQPVDDRPIPIDSNSTGLHEDRYDENTTLWNRNSTGMSEDQYVDKSPLLDSISTGLYEDRYDENSTLADRNKTGTLMDNKYTRPYEDRYDENSTLADRNKTGDDDILLANRTNTGLAKENNDEINGQAWNTLRDDDILLANRSNTGRAKENDYEISVQAWNPSSTRDAPPLITRQETLPSCLLSTCIVHHLSNLLQTGDETAGDKTKDIHGPG
ncbi:uncharacterized protein LOC130372197 isoform X3 [Gadus chalcogrammus]|uniref:uncharacterized protein LOC130372197 isoform X3 n=1 Tax=Gadus chalcogrammus TaxID=1042646 RepID=UPI0024C48350|nr:uncharacterized protein LOC130372197 isoform X3 [Gadus chalcogrammus]